MKPRAILNYYQLHSAARYRETFSPDCRINVAISFISSVPVGERERELRSTPVITTDIPLYKGEKTGSDRWRGRRKGGCRQRAFQFVVQFSRDR